MQIENFISGHFQSAINGQWIDMYEPATGEVYCKCPASDMRDVDLAVYAGRMAFRAWADTPAEEKFKILNRIAEKIDESNQTLAEAESKDQGKPIWLAKNEILRAAQNFRFFATAAMQFSGESHISENRALNYTLQQPIGVVACISPWNLPLYLFTWKIAPALASGNCVIAKPSELTPMTAYLLAKICVEAGLPPGVLNIIHGYGHEVGQAMVEHKEIKAISFTGGTSTGAKIAATAAPVFKKLSLELGGKNPNLIFADCDLEMAVKTTLNSSFMNQGEICLCGSRVYVESSIYDLFKEKLIAAVAEYSVGDPNLTASKLGALVSKEHMNKVLSYIELAKEEGGSILAGGEKVKLEGRCAKGYFVMPTIIEGLSVNSRCNQEEIFGPVISIAPFDTEAQAIELANSTRYGLAATVWTEHLSRAHRVAAALEVGIVWINCWLFRDLRTPFGGVKDSGVGREGGFEAMKFFTEAKNVCIKLN